MPIPLPPTRLEAVGQLFGPRFAEAQFKLISRKASAIALMLASVFFAVELGAYSHKHDQAIAADIVTPLPMKSQLDADFAVYVSAPLDLPAMSDLPIGATGTSDERTDGRLSATPKSKMPTVFTDMTPLALPGRVDKLPTDIYYAFSSTPKAAMPSIIAAGLLPTKAAYSNDMSLRPALNKLRIERGDNLRTALMRNGIERELAIEVERHIMPQLRGKILRADSLLDLIFLPEDTMHSEPAYLHSVKLKDRSGSKLLAGWHGEKPAFWQSPRQHQSDNRQLYPKKREKETASALVERRESPVIAEGKIKRTLIEAISEAGLDNKDSFRVIELLRPQVNFAREIHRGDKFVILLDKKESAGNRQKDYSSILYVSLHRKGKVLELFRMQQPNGSYSYFDAEGNSTGRASLRIPVIGARISSVFGMRKHPILGIRRMHKGVDFAAPTGTPVVAAGDGVIIRAGRNGAYGRFILIQHKNKYQTAYAHLSSISKKIRHGVRVRQGQLIGRVGSSGLSTGPHLHFEVRRRGIAIDPMKIKSIQVAQPLSGRSLTRFAQERDRIKLMLERTRAKGHIVTAAR